MSNYKELVAWQRGMDLIERIYAFTRTLPSEERFGLCTQLQRAAVSIPANLSEGHSRRTYGAYMNHVSVALGSQAEVETLLEVCRRLKIGDAARLRACIECSEETGRILYGLYRSLKRSAGCYTR